MKKIILFIGILALSLVVVACGTNKKNDDTTGQPQDNQSVEDTNTGNNNENNGDAGASVTDGNAGTNQDNQSNAGNQDQLTKMDALDYDEFSLDVEYGSQSDYEVELERNRDDTVEAEIDDTINGVKKSGTEAFDELYPLVEKLTIGQDANKEDAIKEILTVFNLNDDYSKFEVEITFKDGTKIEFEDKK